MDQTITCRCGAVALEISGAPIMAVICHCDSCRRAAARMAQLPGAAGGVGVDGGTPYIMQRKDRVACLRGDAHLAETRLSDGAHTRRVIATCCATPMFLEFEKGHWLSLYADRWPADRRPLPEMRTMTGDDPNRANLPPGLPAPRAHSLGFMVKLMGAWIAMGFRIPKTGYVRGGTLDLPMVATAT